MWSQAEALARPARDALTTRDRARGRKLEAENEFGQEYDPQDMDSARQAVDDGDGALAREDFDKALERYGKAEYYWKQAASKSAPQARPRRKIEALRKATEAARLKAKAKAFTKKYEEAEGYMEKAMADEQKRPTPYWRGAEEYYTRAKAIFDSLAPSPEEEER
jgi:hypothetical protein